MEGTKGKENEIADEKEKRARKVEVERGKQVDPR